MNENPTPSDQPSRRTKVLAVAAILIGVGGMIASGVYLTRNQASAGSPAGTAAEASADLPAAFLTACVAVVHPAGPVALPMRIQDLIPRLTIGAKSPTWERAGGGTFILRQIAEDRLKQTEHRMAFQFDPVKIESTECFALSRLLVDDEEQPQADIWAIAQQFAVQVEMERLNKQANATAAAVSSVAPAEDQPDAAASGAGAGQEQSLLGKPAGGGLRAGQAYSDARRSLIAAGFSPIADTAGDYPAYPEMSCASDRAVCRGDFTGPGGQHIAVLCEYAEDDSDTPPPAKATVTEVMSGD